ncbi:MAG: TonB-dependent receptor [Deltaproteobacteria bacterium]|nr:TonB-dependent receptor [Deltaproteobacteria bacterium]
MHAAELLTRRLGIRFQAAPLEPESEIVLHVRLLDVEAQQQQEVLGIVGVNLVYGAAFLHEDPDTLLASLFDGLSRDRVEIDLVDFSGHRFSQIDNRVMSLRLVQLGLAPVAAFGPDAEVLLPADLLHGKSVLVERGRFRPVTRVHVDMIRCANARFLRDVPGEEPVVLAEITMRNLLADGEVDLRDFLDRADALCAMGYRVLISDYFEYWRLADYLARFTDKPAGLVMGANSLRDLFDERYYQELPGGILEAFGRLFRNDLRIYVYPYLEPGTQKLTGAHALELPPALQALHQFLCERDALVPMVGYDRSLLRFYSPDILDAIRKADDTWVEAVPTPVARLIRSRGLFGHPSRRRGES